MRLREWVAPCLLMWSAELSAQSSPFVSSTVEQALVNEVSGDMAFENLRLITQWHRPGGSEGFFATARYVEARAREYGLEDVTWIDQAGEDASWTCKRAEAWLLEGAGKDAKETKLGSYAEVAVSIADYSRPADLTAELVDVGAGERAKDYEGIEVKGKIVLAYGSVRAVTEEAVWRRGAAGILSWASTRVNPLAEAADQMPPKPAPGAVETRLAGKVPRRATTTLSAWLKLDHEVALKRRIEDSEKRRQREEDERQGKKVEEEQELHHDMQFEAMNLIDGKRDAASIGRFVLAEANAGGSWYYGSATWELVEEFFEKQAKDGLLVW
jgi:hypothetical protein